MARHGLPNFKDLSRFESNEILESVAVALTFIKMRHSDDCETSNMIQNAKIDVLAIIPRVER